MVNYHRQAFLITEKSAELEESQLRSKITAPAVTTEGCCNVCVGSPSETHE